MVAEEMAVVGLAGVAETATVVRSEVMPRVAEETISAGMEMTADRSLLDGMTMVVDLDPRAVVGWTVDSNQVVADSDLEVVVMAVDSDREVLPAAMASEGTSWEDLAVATTVAVFAHRMVQVLEGTVRAILHSLKIDKLRAFHRRLPSVNHRHRLAVHHRPVSVLRHRHEVPSCDRDLRLRAQLVARLDRSTEVRASELVERVVSPIARALGSLLLDRIESIYKIIELSI